MIVSGQWMEIGPVRPARRLNTRPDGRATPLIGRPLLIIGCG